MIGAVPPHDGFGGTATPIKHLVIIFQENISFDHYFGTYPNALNLPLRSLTPASQSQLKPSKWKRGNESVSAEPSAGRDERSGPQLHAGAGSV
jgi:phospholipase C